MSGRRSLALALLGAALVAGCGALGPSPPGPLAHVRALPEASLAPPGSVLIGTSAQDAQETIDGPQPAIYSRVLGTQEAATAVETFYADRLPFAGWTPDPYFIRASIDAWAAAWTKGPVEMSVSILRRGTDPLLPSASMQARYPTIFQVVLSAGAGASFPPS